MDDFDGIWNDCLEDALPPIDPSEPAGAAIGGPGLHWRRLAFVVWRLIGLAVDFVLLIALCDFAWSRAPAWHLVGSALVLIFVLGQIALSSARQMLIAHRTGLDAPSVVLERAVLRLQLEEYRAMKAIALSACFLWLPLLAVVLSALFNVDILPQLPRAWLIANLVLGAVLWTLGAIASRRFVERRNAPEWSRRLLSAFSVGYARGLKRELIALRSW